MFDNFTTLSYILSFPGMIAAIVMLTQFTKDLFDQFFQNRTKYIVYGYAFLLCLIAAAFQGRFSNWREVLETCSLWVINSVIVWFAAMKAYEELTHKEVGKKRISSPKNNA